MPNVSPALCMAAQGQAQHVRSTGVARGSQLAQPVIRLAAASTHAHMESEVRRQVRKVSLFIPARIDHDQVQCCVALGIPQVWSGTPAGREVVRAACRHADGWATLAGHGFW